MQATEAVEIYLQDGGLPIRQAWVVDGKIGPTVQAFAFPNLPGGDGSWFVHFFNGYGHPGYRANPYFVRLVRATQ